MSTETNLAKNGAAQAAFLGTMVGIVVFALVEVSAELSNGVRGVLFRIGTLYPCISVESRQYFTRTMVALVAWLVSWYVFHRLLRNRELNNLAVIAIFLLGIAFATTLIWPPVTPVATYIL